MRQVPQYLVIGDGALASHMKLYLNHLSLNYKQWARRSSEQIELKLLLQESTHVLILISDDAIESVALQLNQWIKTLDLNIVLVHCSGALYTPLAWGAHPLQTFTLNRYYSLVDYERIPFIVDQAAPNWPLLMPGLANKCFQISVQDRPYYHAMCALANNATSLIWQQVHQRMHTRLGLPKDVLQPILQQTFSNIMDSPLAQPSGPWVRGDISTLKRNQKALAEDPLLLIWEAVTAFYQGDKYCEKHS